MAVTHNDKQKAKELPFVAFLIQVNAITEADLKLADALDTSDNNVLIELLASKSILSDKILTSLLKQYSELPYKSLIQQKIDPSLTALLPESVARHLQAAVLEVHDQQCTVGFVNPLDFNLINELSTQLKYFVDPVLVTASQLERFLNLCYRKTAEISALAHKLETEVQMAAKDANRRSHFDQAFQPDNDAAAIRLLETLLLDAIRQGASDVHLEVDCSGLRIRQRIDGELVENILPDKHIADNLFRRLKILADIDISHSLTPQDGGFKLVLDGQTINTRLSIVPNAAGQSAVIRLLGTVEQYSDLDSIITDPEILAITREYLNQTQGMMLFTGPTGSGKTMSQYGCLMELNKPNKKIITMEDPVETLLPRINQIPVNPAIGLDFSDILRASLRQDPDIIMIGEVRDETTAVMSMRSAITGHMVLATLHTNNVITSVQRLINLNVDHYLLAAAVRLIMSQRLVKTICTHCKAPYTLTKQEQALLAQLPKQAKKVKWQHGAGCTQCRHTGYIGRTGIFELLKIDPAMVKALSNNQYMEFYALAEQAMTGRQLINKAVLLAERGTVNFNETIRIMGD